MSVPDLVKKFYGRIWEAGDLEAVSVLVSGNLSFRGSLGAEVSGRAAFLEYARTVRTAVASYRAEVIACVTEGDAAFAKMRFSGIHVGAFRGHAPTGKRIEWLGAALFRIERGRIVELWVLGDLAGLDAMLAANAAS